MNLSSLLTENVERFGEYPLLTYKGRSITNQELDRAVNRAASGLTELGVKTGDRVCLVMGNSPELITLMLACFKLGAWAMPVVLTLRNPELTLILNDAQPTTLISHRLFSESIMEPVKQQRGIRFHIQVGQGPVPENWLAYEDWVVGQHETFMTRDCEPDEIALLLYTSGTTGDPKGVMLSHLNLYSNAINSARSQGLQQGETNLAVLPLNHSFGITAFLASLVYGMRIVLAPRFDPAEVMDLIGRHQVEATALVPTMMALLLEHPDRDKYDFTSLRRVVVGAAPLGKRLRERFLKAFPQVRILEAYGLTEASPGVTVTRPDQDPRPGSVGQSVENQEVCVMDEDGRTLGAGEVGEVCTRGPHVMMGYYHQPDDTAQAVRDGWLHTGDGGYLDEDGHLYLTERLKDMIIRGGENVYPSDVERVLRSHPQVADAAVVGIPDEVYGEEVAAVVVLKPESIITEEQLLEYCLDNLARFQAPKKLVFTQILPRTHLGKVRKRDLRAQLEGDICTGD